METRRDGRGEVREHISGAEPRVARGAQLPAEVRGDVPSTPEVSREESSSVRSAVQTRERIRLLWLIDSFNMGGAVSLVMPFVRGIDGERYDLFICCLTTIGDNVNARDLDVVNLGARNLRDVRAFRRLLRFIRENRIDLIHAHLAYAATWAALASRITGVPSVATLHVAPPSRGLSRVRDRLMRFALRRWSSGVIAVSDALRRQYGDDRFVVAHNGIDVDRFAGSREESRELLARESGIPRDAKVVATVSVLREGKGVEVLLRAFEQIDDAYLLIIGDGPKRAEWQALAGNGRIPWAGFRRAGARVSPRAGV